MNALYFRASCQIRLSRELIVEATLSCPEFPLEEKDLATGGHTSRGRRDPLEHLFLLRQAGRVRNPDNPHLVIGVRNVLANHRCIAYNAALKGASGPHAVVGEHPLASKRSYHILFQQDDGRLGMAEHLPAWGSRDFQWYCSGVPVLWDDLEEAQLWQRMVTEAADPAHLYHLPRGDHPDATDVTRQAWHELHDTFVRTLEQPRETAFQEIAERAAELALDREWQYFHSILGIRHDGDLVLSVGYGKLEDLGRRMRDELGAERAICFENSGSITVLLYPKGIGDVRCFDERGEQRWVIASSENSLIAAPNKRRPGTAFLVLELAEFDFQPL